MNKTKSLRYSVALAAACAGLLQAQAQTPFALPAAWALPDSAGDAASPGFRVRVTQANTRSGQLQTSVARAEDQLAGTLIDPITGLPYANDIDRVAFTFDAAGFYNEPATIAYEQGGNALNGFIPGIPGIDLQNDNIAMEALTWLKLAPGDYTMVVNSDDGFRVTAGRDARDRLDAVELGVFDAGRGAGDSAFTFSVTKEGLYSFRLVYFEGGGGANVSWLTAPGGDLSSQVLINDAGGVTAIRKVNADSLPYVSLAQPGKGQSSVSPSKPIKVGITDGGTHKVADGSVKLSLDGTVVAATVTRSGDTVTASYTPPDLLGPLSVHTARLVFSDDATPTATSRTNDWTFTVAQYTNIKLPAPIVLEDFETTDEGGIPVGWTRQNFTSSLTPGDDLNDPSSDSYLDWTVISRDRVIAIGAFDPPRWDGPRRLNVAENYVNGKRVDALVVGKFAYAESDTRGGSQVQYLFTKDYDLTGKNNIYVSYNSIYEQNQDSLGAVEYSIDQGATWLPILYMLDGPDIVLDAQGKTDAVATFTAANGDTASYTDPITGENKGGNYGDFIGAPITADLAPFIQARLNDDPIESKRVEFFRLPKADNQSKVRFRFAQAGTGSWYFGIDNLGLYSVTVIDPPTIATQPASTTAYAGLSFTLNVSATGIGLGYQWNHNAAPIAGATGSSYIVSKSALGDAGDYTVTVTNGGGTKTSDKATVTVLTAPATIPVNDGLALYLPFDGNLTDSSVNHANGTAVGAPTFATAVFGQGVHIKTLKDATQNDYVTLDYPASLKFGADKDFTVSFWVKVTDQADDQPFISNKNWASSNNQGWGIFSQGGNTYRVNITGPNGSADKFSKTPGSNVGNGSFHNLVVSVARTGKVNSYVDGNLNDSTAIVEKGSIDTDALATPLTFNIGQDGTGVYTDGGSAQVEFVMDDLAIWSRALPADQVASIYLGGAAGKPLSQLAVSTTSKLAITQGAGSVTITWTGTGTLKGSSTLGGTYTPVAGAGANSATVPTTDAQQFFHLE